MKLCCAAVLLLTLTSIARSAPAPEETLKQHGLTKVGALYLLQDDIKLPEKLRLMRAAKYRVDDNAARRSKIQNDIEAAKTTITQCTHDLANEEAILARSRRESVFRRMGMVGRIQQLEATRMDAVRFIEAREKELSKLDNPSDQYVNAVKDVATYMEKVAKDYEALANDGQVQDALAIINGRGGIKSKLGPSPQFLTELPQLRKARDSLREGIVKLTLEGGTPHAYATINGTLTLLMTVDTGAAAVTLSADSANKLGLRPDARDPTVKVSTADGKVTDVKVMTLDSIKVGQFTVQNVKCYVLPQKVAGSNLLGGTFLRNFICRMDLSALELHLTQVGPAQDPPQAAPKSDRLDAIAKEFTKTGKLTVAVNATDDWVNFLPVKKGDALTISATGAWFFGAAKTQEVGPAGKAKLAYLEGKIGDTLFRINESATITAPADGVLSMRMNDTMRSDNSGALTVTIIRKAN